MFGQAENRRLWTVLTVLILSMDVVFARLDVPRSYQQKRDAILKKERSLMIGANITLTPDEERVNNWLMKMKRKEYEGARVKDRVFPPAQSFFLSRSTIDQSLIFRFIQKMPKGGALHTHDSSITSLEWLVKNATYRDNCYMCFKPNGQLQFQFNRTAPQPMPDCDWKTVAAYRRQSGNAKAFDDALIRNMSIIVDDPAKAYPTIDKVWDKFDAYFDQIDGLFKYAPVFRDYFRRALEEFQADQVQYMEIRALLLPTYELDGSTHDKFWAMKTYDDVLQKFVAENPDFFGAKIIVSSSKSKSEKDIFQDIKDAIKLKTDYPKLVAGYDLVGQEDRTSTLYDYIDALLYPSESGTSVQLPFFFHAGETDWEDTIIDENLVDAVLLNTTRIGHGFALSKHPVVMETVKQKDIAVEVNPISNQVLGLVKDLRTHPATQLIANNYAVVISSDDKAAWDALALSHDFYMALMALSGEEAGLRLLKQLALNSIKYSAMTPEEKTDATKKWEAKWNKFIKEIVHDLKGEL